ncbi:SDR family NAD(P)-dependent oxidoreductase [Novosphingobium resinovorum]
MDIFRQDALAGKAILVTGGGSGLGREIARSLSARGAVVHICGRRQALLDETAAEISAATGGAVHAHACDIRDADAVDAMVEAIWQTGPLSGLFNNAAANFIAPTKDLSARASAR